MFYLYLQGKSQYRFQVSYDMKDPRTQAYRICGEDGTLYRFLPEKSENIHISDNEHFMYLADGVAQYVESRNSDEARTKARRDDKYDGCLYLLIPSALLVAAK
jgi:hypothetical protein